MIDRSGLQPMKAGFDLATGDLPMLSKILGQATGDATETHPARERPATGQRIQ
jgi:hypothetical protein